MELEPLVSMPRRDREQLCDLKLLVQVGMIGALALLGFTPYYSYGPLPPRASEALMNAAANQRLLNAEEAKEFSVLNTGKIADTSHMVDSIHQSTRHILDRERHDMLDRHSHESKTEYPVFTTTAWAIKNINKLYEGGHVTHFIRNGV